MKGVEYLEDNDIQELEDINEREEEEKYTREYVENKDIKRSFDYIRNLEDRSKELISYYNAAPSLNTIYKKENINKSCSDIKLLQKTFEESPALQSELKVYRGLSIKDSDPINFDLNQLISTSTTYKIAQEFLKDNLSERKIILDIKLKTGVKFLAISLPRTMFSSEHEILLPPGGYFNVISDERTYLNTWNVEEERNVRIPILKINIEYSQNFPEVSCDQEVISSLEQRKLIITELSKSSDLTTFKQSILDSNDSNIKNLIKYFILSLNQSYRYILIDLMIKSNSIELDTVYDAYLYSISIIEKKMSNFFKQNEISKYNRVAKKEFDKLRTLISIDKVSNRNMFKFDPSKY